MSSASKGRASGHAGRPALLVVALVSAGCGPGEAEPPPSPPAPPDAGAEGCAPGLTILDDGSCRAPGVPPEACAPGFAPDSAGGCAAVMPAAPCAPGSMALPGETACRELMPCGEAPWGTIPIEPGAQHVDASFAGASYGTALNPWRTIAEAVDAVDDGGMIAIAEGTYPEVVVIGYRTVRLWGRCPAKVHLTGAAGASVSLAIGKSSGSEVHGVSVSGPEVGVLVEDAEDVLLDRVWIHDTGSDGLEIAGFAGEAGSARVTGSLIELATRAGVVASSAEVTIEASAIRDTRPLPTTPSGRGVAVQRTTASDPPSVLHLLGSVLERNHNAGLHVEQSEATIEGSLVRDTLAAPANANAQGAWVDTRSPDAPRATLRVRSSAFERNGIVSVGSDLTVEQTTLRGTREDESAAPGGLSTLGAAIVAASYPGTHVRASAAITDSLIDDSQGIGVVITGADATLAGSIVRGTVPGPMGGPAVGALVFHEPEAGERGALTVTSSLFEGNHGVGVATSGGDLVVRRSESSRNLPAPDGGYGRGLQAEGHATDPFVPASCLVEGSAFHDNFEEGVMIAWATATLRDLVVTGTKASAAGGDLGDGIGVIGGLSPATVEIESVELLSNARAGVANFGASVAVRRATIDCNAFHLSADPYEGQPASFEDGGDNACGCSGEAAPCKALSASLTPPTVVEAGH